MTAAGVHHPLGGAAAAWPLAGACAAGRARAAHRTSHDHRPGDPEMQGRVQALQQQLQNLGWSKGVNVHFDQRWTGDDMELIRANAVNLVELNPDVIVHCRWTCRSDIHSADPLDPNHYSGRRRSCQDGLGDKPRASGDNVSGFTFYEPSILGKMLEILKQFAPTVSVSLVSIIPTMQLALTPCVRL